MTKFKTIQLFSLIGLVQGGWAYLVWNTLSRTKLLSISSHLTVSALFFVFIFGWFITFSHNKATLFWRMGRAFLWSLPFFFSAYWVLSQITLLQFSSGDTCRLLSFVPCSGFSFFILLAFFQSYAAEGKLCFPYKLLYRDSWTNLVTVFLSIVFLGIYWFLILLWTSLFSLIKINIFSKIFTSTPFIYLTSGIILSLGIYLVRENEKILEASQRALNTLFSFLLPMITAFSVLFIFSLPFQGLKLLWETGSATYILVSLIVVALVFVNKAYQDGESESISPWIKKVLIVMILCLPIYAVLAAYSLWLRFDQYGLSPDRYKGIVVVCFCVLYSFGYVFAVFKRKPELIWIHSLREWNKFLAFALVMIFFLLHTPLLDPVRWSVQNQTSRLLSGKVDPQLFDFDVFQREYGSIGKNSLESFTTLELHPQATMIRQRAKQALENIKVLEKNFQTIGSENETTRSFIDFMSNPENSNQSYCQKPKECYLLVHDVDNQGLPEVIVVENSNWMSVYSLKDGKWIVVGSYRSRTNYLSQESLVEIKQELLRSALVPPIVKDLKIGKFLYYFVSSSGV